MTQLIHQPTSLESRGISCVDLIITDQPNLFVDYRINSSLHNLFVDYGIHSSLGNCCHHQIIHGKVNISISSPPPFKRRIWNYAKANEHEIRECLNNIDYHSFRGPNVCLARLQMELCWAANIFAAR